MSSRSPGSARRSAICSNSSAIDLRPQVEEAGHGPEAVERRLQPLRRLAQARVIGLSPYAASRASRSRERVEALPRVEPEDGAQDDLHRQPLHPGVQLELGRPVPGANLGLGHTLDQPSEPFHALAMERGQHQLALLHVDAAVEQDHGVVADDRLQHPRPLTRAQDVGRRGEHLLDLLRLGDHHERRRERELQRKALAVARPAALEEGQGPGPEAQHWIAGRVGGSWGRLEVTRCSDRRWRPAKRPRRTGREV